MDSITKVTAGELMTWVTSLVLQNEKLSELVKVQDRAEYAAAIAVYYRELEDGGCAWESATIATPQVGPIVTELLPMMRWPDCGSVLEAPCADLRSVVAGFRALRESEMPANIHVMLITGNAAEAYGGACCHALNAYSSLVGTCVGMVWHA